MSRTQPDVDVTGDAELIAAVRGGDLEAYGELFERHVAAARRLARQLMNASDADDLVSDAFAKVLRVLQRGGGPDLAFRAYLLTSIRRLHVDRIRANSRLRHTDDLEPFDPGVPFRDTAVEGFENAAAAKAFASLPERWQMVLWHTEVEGQKPAEVAELLGMSANSVSALAYRAREGLRQAFLTSHAQEIEDEGCRWTNDHLGGYVRKALSRRDTTKVETHLDECRRCMAIYLELSEVNSGLGALLAPLLLGTAGAGYLAATSGAAVKGGLVLLLARTRDVVVGNSQAAALTGAAAVVTATGVTVAVATGGGEPPAPPVRAESLETAPAPGSRAPEPTPRRKPRERVTAPTSPAAPESSASATAPAPAPETVPMPDPLPSRAPTQTPSPTPDPEPEEAKSPGGGTDETGPAEEPTETTPRSDLALAVTLQRRGLGATVTYDVTGIAAGRTAELRLSWSGAILSRLPAGCARTGGRSAICELATDGTHTWSGVRFTRGAVDMVATPVGFTDLDPDNNSWHWPGP